jgi:hypothetical protein
MISAACLPFKRMSIQIKSNSKVMQKWQAQTNEFYLVILKNKSKVFKAIDQSFSARINLASRVAHDFIN